MKAFLAYQDSVPQLGDTLEQFKSLVNENSREHHIKSWKESGSVGNYIISEVCKDIDESDVFICELSILNKNVIFELGYAIAKSKKIFHVFDPNRHTSEKKLKEFHLINSIKRVKYNNYYE